MAYMFSQVRPLGVHSDARLARLPCHATRAIAAQVQALRSIEKYLGLDKLYVLGTNCVDNGPRQGLEKFLNAASESPSTVLHYEFVQDYRGGCCTRLL